MVTSPRYGQWWSDLVIWFTCTGSEQCGVAHRFHRLRHTHQSDSSKEYKSAQQRCSWFTCMPLPNACTGYRYRCITHRSMICPRLRVSHSHHLCNFVPVFGLGWSSLTWHKLPHRYLFVYECVLGLLPSDLGGYCSMHIASELRWLCGVGPEGPFR